ncbi:MAG TPA: UDP-N-acetylmuramate--L-alanine ligase [Dehalococcoidia bacterium]|nr:UDP-N-acetylmuramate--L-alanine ligase [Dehalococcoidia bacterium]
MLMAAKIPQRVHLVGVGGAHMSAIARILLARGHEVSGSDQRVSATTVPREEQGLRFELGHEPAHARNAELVVYTVAVPADNAELGAARGSGIEVITRAQMVSRLLEGLRLIAISGAHGKTTTSSLVAYLLKSCGMSPTYLVGGDSDVLAGNAAAGDGEWAVVEADEYGRAFLEYEPEIAVVTNVEADHLDYYGDYDSLKAAFRQFLERVQPDGVIIAATGSDGLDDVLDKARPSARILRYGANGAATWKGSKLTSEGGLQTFRLMGEGQDYGSFTTALPGLHNVWNAVGGLAAAIKSGADLEIMRSALPHFTGARRRFELVGEAQGISIYDDYAHHPTEIAVNVQAARDRFPGRRLVVLFQPHTYSRTRYLLDEFRTCFQGIDRLFILETFAAREAIAEGIEASALAEAVTTPQATYLPTHERALEVLTGELHNGDVFFTMGAGDVDKIGPDLLKRLGGEA